MAFGVGVQVPHIAAVVSIVWIIILAYFRFRKEIRLWQENRRLRKAGIHPDVIKEFRRWDAKRRQHLITDSED